MEPAIAAPPARQPPSRDGPEPTATATATGMARSQRRRMAAVNLGVLFAFGSIAGQLIHLGLKARNTHRSSMLTRLSQSWSRPDIVDRKGRLLATDVYERSLFANPSIILDVDEVVEQLTGLFPDMNEAGLRARLSDRRRHFVWLRRALNPRVAQQVHDLGLPGLGFRRELHRIYPAGAIAGHILGRVDPDNKGIAGIERYIDEHVGILPAQGAQKKLLAPLVLSLDLGVQHDLHAVLSDALKRYRAKAASGVVLDVKTGEIVAAVSLPDVDPARPAQAIDPKRRDRLAGGTYELGSVFKAFTIAMALDSGAATLSKTYDVTRPLLLGRKLLTEHHAPNRPISVREVFIYSSNVGAAMMGQEAGPQRQRAFLARMGLLSPMRTEAGPVAKPSLPRRWSKVATATISYGHGLAVSPLQFATAAAALVNGGIRIKASFLPTIPKDKAGGPMGDAAPSSRVLSAATSASLRQIMRLNVTSRHGTGRRAASPGYRVGGKTGTAEIASKNGYAKKSVVSSFLAAFPMDAPRYLTLVSIFQPKGTTGQPGRITASVNAAPATARLVRRIAPLLAVYPRPAIR